MSNVNWNIRDDISGIRQLSWYLRNQTKPNQAKLPFSVPRPKFFASFNNPRTLNEAYA